MTQILDKINNDAIIRVRGPNSNFAIHGPEAQSKMKINIVTQTKWGVYN